MLLLILLSRLFLLLTELMHPIAAQVLQVLSVGADLLRLLLDLVHELAPGLEYLTAYVMEARKCKH